MPKPEPKKEKPKPVFRTTPEFRRALDKLNGEQRAKADETFKVFKVNPFDPSLKTHKINKLTARYGRTIFSATIEGNLRAAFYIDGNNVVSVDIGTHDIYK